jgi:hypothetical protein
VLVVEVPSYHVRESAGIAVGFVLAAPHAAGLATLPCAPSPMEFLNRILGRPRTSARFSSPQSDIPAYSAAGFVRFSRGRFIRVRRLANSDNGSRAPTRQRRAEVLVTRGAGFVGTNLAIGLDDLYRWLAAEPAVEAVTA